MAGQDLIAKVRVETGPAEEQLKAFLGKSRTLTVDVKANTKALLTEKEKRPANPFRMLRLNRPKRRLLN